MRSCLKGGLCETLKWKSFYLYWMIIWKVSCYYSEGPVCSSCIHSPRYFGDKRITSGTGTPINESSSDYVWDVFYHRPASLSEWNSVAARTGTMCVSAFANFVNYRLWVQVPVYLAHSSTRMIQIQDQKQKTRLMRIRMVGAVVSWFPLPWVFPAEEYYKNDYPDEDYDSESASGLSHYHLEWCWPDQC